MAYEIITIELGVPYISLYITAYTLQDTNISDLGKGKIIDSNMPSIKKKFLVSQFRYSFNFIHFFYPSLTNPPAENIWASKKGPYLGEGWLTSHDTVDGSEILHQLREQ